ncbi:MAG: hypothetical protein LBH64_00430 [Coriobacteriales bacterium]|jgi:uncharacterized phage infection (PIP) family protein YhgE|nr:hypothetical protein [Coriobacteriales bacterium]
MMKKDETSGEGHLSGAKALLIAPVAVVVLSLLIALIVYPVAKLEPKDLPVALLSEDEGVELPSGMVDVGALAVESIPEAMAESFKDEAAPIKWVRPSNREEALALLEDGEVYAALIFPSGFSTGLMSVMSPAPTAPTLEVYMNQGAQPAVASALSAMLPNIEEGLAAQTRTMLAEALRAGAEAMGQTSVDKAVLEMYQRPFVTELSYVHELPKDMAGGQSHLFAFVILWICCLVASAILFRLLPLGGRRGALKARALLFAGELLVALTLALMLVFIMRTILGVDVPVAQTIGFGLVASLCVLLMIHGVLAWSGIGGISLFVLVMALGLIASNLPYELLPTFWQDWIYPWIPLRFISEGLRSIFYEGAGIFNAATSVLLWIGAGGLALLLLSVFKPSPKRGKTAKPQEGGAASPQSACQKPE